MGALDVEVTRSDGRSVSPAPLRSWLIEPRRIGGRNYQGECRVARVRDATYQQQSSTFGRTAGVLGLASNGRGFVTGGGGTIDTIHRGIVSVVIEYEDGRHEVQEFPAAAALLEGGTVRIDGINGRVVAVTNLSGRQDRIIVLGPSGFIEGTSFTKAHAVLLLSALVAVGQVQSDHPLAAVVIAFVLGILPVLRLGRMYLVKRRREQLKDYMVEVLS